MIRFAKLLTEDEVIRVHEASLEILEQIGVSVRSEKARDRFVKHGCRVDAGSDVVKFPRDVVEHFRSACPPSFTYHGRDPRFDRTIPDDGPLFVTGSSAPDVKDPVTGEIRRSRSDDIAKIAHMVNRLEGFDLYGISVIADDAPQGWHYFSRFYPALKNCLKPVRGSAPSLEEAEKILEMCEIVAGGKEAFWERPFVTFQSCPMISPLVLEPESTDKLMRFAELGVPCATAVAPTAGMTAPLSLIGTIALVNAEFLALAVLEQMSRPGKPTVYESVIAMADMRTGAYATGAIESGIMEMGCAQMARYYNIPCGGFSGMTNAKLNDAQAGYETGMSTMAFLLAGADLITVGCLLNGLIVFDYGNAVISHEIARMLKRTARGLNAVPRSEEPCTEEDLAVAAIAAIGPGGMFLDTPHTMERIRTESMFPEIADRRSWNQWEEKGGLDAHARAMQRVHELLSQDNPAVFSHEVDDRIQAKFDGVVRGTTSPIV